jgi:hypothetical protein
MSEREKNWLTVSWNLEKKRKTQGSEWFLWSHFLNGWLLFLDIRILCPTKICSQVSNSSLSSGKSHLAWICILTRERTFQTNIFYTQCYLIYILYILLFWSEVWWLFSKTKYLLQSAQFSKPILIMKLHISFITILYLCNGIFQIVI